MPTPLETWFTEIPPITRIYITAACFTSVSVQLGFIHPLHLWLNYESIVHDFQWWRLISNFFYFGPLSIDFFFHIFFLARYSRMMEEGFFRNKPADYVWLMIFSASILILCSIIIPFASLPFLGSALAFTMVYIWARRNPYVRLNFLGLVVFTAPNLPWVLLCFSLFLGGQVPVGDMLGVLVGHLYYFFEDVWPNDPMSHGKKWLATPRIIRWLVEGNRMREGVDIVEEEEEVVEEPVVEEAEVVESSTSQHNKESGTSQLNKESSTFHINRETSTSHLNKEYNDIKESNDNVNIKEPNEFNSTKDSIPFESTHTEVDKDQPVSKISLNEDK
ncbi:Der1-like family-domain-containing protein [Pilobolus umbonatus]|nr:Der1-like family-domain-containing protein [Pilobolus umbonatus]